MYQINPSSQINPEHLDYFNFLGKLLAKCVCDGITTPFSHFTPDVYAPRITKPRWVGPLAGCLRSLLRRGRYNVLLQIPTSFVSR